MLAVGSIAFQYLKPEWPRNERDTRMFPVKLGGRAPWSTQNWKPTRERTNRGLVPAIWLRTPERVLRASSVRRTTRAVAIGIEVDIRTRNQKVCLKSLFMRPAI